MNKTLWNKCLCVQTYYMPHTFKVAFEKGKIYEYEICDLLSTRATPNGECVRFKDVRLFRPMELKTFKRYFKTIQELRNNKLEEILK